MKVLELDDPERCKEFDRDGDFEGRTGVFTSASWASVNRFYVLSI